MEKSPIVDIVKKVSPAVVSIIISKDIPKIEGFYRMPVGGRSFLVPKFKEGETETKKIGSGSGFFITQDGILLTNSHVVQDPKAEYTAIVDGEVDDTKKMEIIARDPLHDIAICKIAGDNYPFLELGDPSQLELGEEVIAVGNALGEFSNTVSAGIVSGLSRF